MRLNQSSSRASNSMLELLNATITMATILKDIHMEKYIDKFYKEEIDIQVFCVLTLDDLQELNIEMADMKTFLDAIQFYSDIFDITPENFFKHTANVAASITPENFFK